MFIRLLSVCTIQSFGDSFVSYSKGTMECLTLNNRSCEARSTLIKIISDKTFFHIFTVSVNKCGRSCNTANDPYARVCVLNKVKNMNVKVFNLMFGVKEKILLVL